MIISAETTKNTKLIETHYIAKLLSESYKFDLSSHFYFEDLRTLLALVRVEVGQKNIKLCKIQCNIMKKHDLKV